MSGQITSRVVDWRTEQLPDPVELISGRWQGLMPAIYSWGKSPMCYPGFRSRSHLRLVNAQVFRTVMQYLTPTQWVKRYTVYLCSTADSRIMRLPSGQTESHSRQTGTSPCVRSQNQQHAGRHQQQPGLHVRWPGRGNADKYPALHGLRLK